MYITFSVHWITVDVAQTPQQTEIPDVIAVLDFSLSLRCVFRSTKFRDVLSLPSSGFQKKCC